MLLLTRRLRQSIMIGDHIEIFVLKIENSQVHLGIKAPENVPVFRREIFQALQSENIISLQSSSKALQKAIQGLKKKFLS